MLRRGGGLISYKVPSAQGEAYQRTAKCVGVGVPVYERGGEREGRGRRGGGKREAGERVCVDGQMDI